LALGGEKGRGYLRQQLFPLRARFLHAANRATCALSSAERFQSISLRLQTVSEDWRPVMCSLCQHTKRAVRP